MYGSFLKRLFDIFIATTAFAIAFPVFAIITILLLIVNRGMPFFFQKRPGKNERIFSVIKFKTMTDEKDEKENCCLIIYASQLLVVLYEKLPLMKFLNYSKGVLLSLKINAALYMNFWISLITT